MFRISGVLILKLILQNAINIIKSMIKIDPVNRFSAEDVLKHCWLYDETNCLMCLPEVSKGEQLKEFLCEPRVYIPLCGVVGGLIIAAYIYSSRRQRNNN